MGFGASGAVDGCGRARGRLRRGLDREPLLSELCRAAAAQRWRSLAFGSVGGPGCRWVCPRRVGSATGGHAVRASDHALVPNPHRRPRPPGRALDQAARARPARRRRPDRSRRGAGHGHNRLQDPAKDEVRQPVSPHLLPTAVAVLVLSSVYARDGLQVSGLETAASTDPRRKARPRRSRPSVDNRERAHLSSAPEEVGAASDCA